VEKDVPPTASAPAVGSATRNVLLATVAHGAGSTGPRAHGNPCLVDKLDGDYPLTEA
jgi:hypothetical protein